MNTDTALNKEQIYDEHISPLMTQIINICMEHSIGMVATFHISTPEDEGLRCTSAVIDIDKGAGTTLDSALITLLQAARR